MVRSSSTVQLAAPVFVLAEGLAGHFGVSLIARAVGHCHGAEAASGVLWCKSQAVLPKPLGLPWLHHSTAGLGCPTLAAVGRSPGRVCISEEHPETQVPPRARLRSRDHTALCGEKPVLAVGGPA